MQKLFEFAFLFYFAFWPHNVAWGILVPQPRVELAPPAVELAPPSMEAWPPGKSLHLHF